MEKKISAPTMVVVILLGWICLCYLACEWTPQRDNPLDPNSELYHPLSPGSIAGVVRNLSGSSLLPGVVVNLESGSQGVVTGSDGSYLIENVADGQHWVRIHKEGYAEDSTQVTVSTGVTSTADFHMNALPYFDSVSVTLHRIRVVPSYDEYVTIYSRIIDIDGNISILLPDTAVLAIFEGDTIGKLNYSSSQTSGTFSFGRDFPISELVSNSQDIVGRPFTLIAIDQTRAFRISEPYSVARWLDVPNPVYPMNQQAVPTPTLIWDPYSAAFSYVQNTRIFDNLDALVWDSLSIASGVVQVTVSDSLLTTNSTYPIYYYWTIEVVDIFGNAARSMKATFYVH